MARNISTANVTARHYEIWKGVNATLETINAYVNPSAANEDDLRVQLRSIISETGPDADKQLREKIIQTLGEYPEGQSIPRILLPKTGPNRDGERISIVEGSSDMQSLRGAPEAVTTPAPPKQPRIPGNTTTSRGQTIVNELEVSPPRVDAIMAETHETNTEPVWLTHSALYGEVLRNVEVPQTQGQYAHLGESLEILHYAVWGYFRDTEGYHKERREAELLNDVKAVMTTPGKAGIWSLEGVRDIHLTNWISQEVSQYNGYSTEGQLLFQLQNQAHVFMHFEIVHVYPKQGPIQRMARGGRRA